MADAPISRNLRNFIAGNIQSVEQLEILCLLVEAPSKSWTVTDAYRRIQSTEKSVLDGLHTLSRTTCSRRMRAAPFDFHQRLPR